MTDKCKNCKYYDENNPKCQHYVSIMAGDNSSECINYAEDNQNSWYSNINNYTASSIISNNITDISSHLAIQQNTTIDDIVCEKCIVCGDNLVSGEKIICNSCKNKIHNIDRLGYVLNDIDILKNKIEELTQKVDSLEGK